MRETEYRSWLALQGREPSTQNTSVSAVRRIEAAYGDLEQEFALSGLDTILTELIYSKSDQKNNEPNPSKVQIDGDIYNGLSSLRTHLNYYRRFLEEIATKATVAEVVKSSAAAPITSLELAEADPPEAVLSLERDLNAALRQNISQLEAGLHVVDGGKERSVASGRIDILAEDSQGRKVVIELKAVRAPRDAVAQVLAYMGDIQAENGGDVRGLLIAPDFDPKAISAARMVPSLELKRFSFQFTFEPVGPTA
jgi:RecB family endonuclease NucS